MNNKFDSFTDEELLLELINRNVLGDAPNKIKFVSPHYDVLVAIGNNETARITLPKEGFSELCDIVYGVQCVERPSIKNRTLWNDENVEICDLDGFDDTFMIASVTNLERYVFVTDIQLAECNKAVKERKPEIKACPFCEGDCYTWNPDENDWSVACHDCTYNSGCIDTESEAIELHNLIAGKGE